MSTMDRRTVWHSIKRSKYAVPATFLEPSFHLSGHMTLASFFSPVKQAYVIHFIQTHNLLSIKSERKTIWLTLLADHV